MNPLRNLSVQVAPLAVALLAFVFPTLSPAAEAPANHATAPTSPPVATPTPVAVQHEVRIKPGPSTPVVITNALKKDAAPVAVACSTCHTTRPPNREARSAEALKDFHQGLAYRHGDQTCLSCHNSTNYDTLRKADGSALPYPRVMELCAQCHGPQYRDYRAGAHGGMNGYWDLTRGPRERNNCVSCHDPHAPAYPTVMPVFPPADRGARQQQQRAAHHSADEVRHD